MVIKSALSGSLFVYAESVSIMVSFKYSSIAIILTLFQQLIEMASDINVTNQILTTKVLYIDVWLFKYHKMFI